MPPITSQMNTSPTVDSKKNPEKEFHVFHCTVGSCNMITPSGMRLTFTEEGKHITDNKEAIRYLKDEISKGHIYLKSLGTMTSSELDPMEALRKKHIAEYLEEEAKKEPSVLAAMKEKAVAAQLDKNRIAKGAVGNNGVTVNVPGLVPASTAKLAATTPESNTK